MVIKKDGRREPFQRQKVLTGLMKACEKRPIPVSVLEQVVDEIEREARRRGDAEITSRQIGERIMEALRGIDEVAYVRFASVYRDFRDLTALLGEVEKLVKRE